MVSDGKLSLWVVIRQSGHSKDTKSIAPVLIRPPSPNLTPENIIHVVLRWSNKESFDGFQYMYSDRHEVKTINTYTLEGEVAKNVKEVDVEDLTAVYETIMELGQSDEKVILEFTLQ